MPNVAKESFDEIVSILSELLSIRKKTRESCCKNRRSEEKNLVKLPLSLPFDSIFIAEFSDQILGGKNSIPGAVFAEIFLFCCLEKSTKIRTVSELFENCSTLEKFEISTSCQKLSKNCVSGCKLHFILLDYRTFVDTSVRFCQSVSKRLDCQIFLDIAVRL
jgi:hypothetical protein